MTTPEERKLKSFQRLIAPSADATDDIDGEDAEDSAADAVPQGHRELLRRARDVLREQGNAMSAASLAQQVFATGEGMAGGAWTPLLNAATACVVRLRLR